MTFDLMKEPLRKDEKMRVRVKRVVAIVLAASLALAGAVAGVWGAAAAESETLTSTLLDEDYSLKHVVNGNNLFLGVIGTDSRGRKYYCIQTSRIADFRITGSSPITGADAARLAWLLDRYSDSRDARIHAALALLAHDHHDEDPAEWRVDRQALMQRYPDVESRARSLWDESESLAPMTVAVRNEYDDASRSGRVVVSVKNVNGGEIAGVPYRLSMDGEAAFDAGGSSLTDVSGRSDGHRWVARGRGGVSVSVVVETRRLDRVLSAQNLVRVGGAASISAATRFEVRRDFVPTIATVVPRRVMDIGAEVVDMVTADVADGEGTWKPGLRLDARGWFFDGLSADAADEEIRPDAGEDAAAFLERLADRGLRPSAYATASFTAPGQTVEAHALTSPDGGEVYRTARPGIGTWVWAFSRESLSREAREYVLKDVVSPFMDQAETVSVRSTVQVESVVTEHTALQGAELGDTITVAGFPDDHGDFSGDASLGLKADNPHATVSVWWAGDGENHANDERYRPEGDDVPQEDANHRLVGTWTYAARNGVIRVGGGAPDVDGRAVTITARDPGWYVFVWSFTGDDRVAPASSSYGDAWERVRVWPAPESPDISEPIGIVTSVEPDLVYVGEFFHDRATVTGDVPGDATVEFTAYEAVDDGVEPGSSGKLLDAVAVPIRCEYDNGGCVAVSPQVRSSREGLVYWRAAVVSKDGDVLASHDLGVPGEVVTVKRKAENPVLAKTGSSIYAVTAVVVAMGFLGVAVLVTVIRARRR